MTDAGLEALSGLKKLESLMIVANLTDAGIRHLEKLTNLTTYKLLGTKVTLAGIDRLHQALPRCRIEWDGGAAEALKK